MPYRDPGIQREYQRQWMARRRARYVEMFGGRCLLCGATEELEFDHRDPALKEREVRDLWSRREDVLLAELLKTRLLCRQCHDFKSRLEVLPGHGTGAMYGRGCRCPECDR